MELTSARGLSLHAVLAGCAAYLSEDREGDRETEHVWTKFSPILSPLTAMKTLDGATQFCTSDLACLDPRSILAGDQQGVREQMFPSFKISHYLSEHAYTLPFCGEESCSTAAVLWHKQNGYDWAGKGKVR